MNDVDFYDVIGFAGVLIVGSNYALMQWRRDYNKSFIFSLLNAISALMMCFSLITNFNRAAFLLDCIWFLVSMYGVYRCLKYDWRAPIKKKNQLRRKDDRRVPWY